MRCIEIAQCHEKTKYSLPINRNMRCIEMFRDEDCAEAEGRLIET